MSKITTASLLKMKQEGQKFTAITAYDATFAKLFDDEGAHVLLIGDSLGMTLQGRDSTLPVTLDEMAYHVQCVARGNRFAFVQLSDPTGLYEVTCFSEVLEASRDFLDAGSNVVLTVKAELEGDLRQKSVEAKVKELTDAAKVEKKDDGVDPAILKNLVLIGQ